MTMRGAFVRKTRLSKRRAAILLECVDLYRAEWYSIHSDKEEGYEEAEKEMQEAMQWIINNVSKRYSQSELSLSV